MIHVRRHAVMNRKMCQFLCRKTRKCSVFWGQKFFSSYARFQTSAALFVRSSLFWDVTQRSLVVPDVSGQTVGLRNISN